MRAAPEDAAAMMAAMPTAPAPNTAMVQPGSGRSASRIAPAPVWMPQPSGASVVQRRVVRHIDKAALVARPACRAKADWPKKWPCTGRRHGGLWLPSARSPRRDWGVEVWQ